MTLSPIKKRSNEVSDDDIPQKYKLIGMKSITRMTDFTSAYFYKKIAEGHFPEPIKFGRKSRWRLSDVLEWIDEHQSS